MSLKHCKFFLKQRPIDDFTQKWISDLTNNRVLDFYKYVKTDFDYEKYQHTVEQVFKTWYYENPCIKSRLESRLEHIEETDLKEMNVHV